MIPYRKFKNLKELRDYVKRNDENDILEYKLSYVLFSKKDQDKEKKIGNLLETVSAFDNTKGGLIIIGADEKKKQLDQGVNLLEWNEKRLRDIIDGNLEPRLEGLKIKIIKKKNERFGYFLIYVPEGITAYQNKIDKKYYGRFGDKDEALDDYWIRLLMNKFQKPLFDVFLIPGLRIPNNNTQTRLAFRIIIKNLSVVPSREYTIEIMAEESLELFYVQYIKGSGDILVREESISINNKKFKKILLTSNYHLGNQIILLPQQEIEIKRFESYFHIGFNTDQPEGLLKIVIYSENPQPQYFYYKFTSEFCNKILNELRQGIKKEGEIIIPMNKGKLEI
ncbi:MAG: helix-turn-helix domain-containing protein [Minisyncoccia bacterium]|jgi:hypothetical protein